MASMITLTTDFGLQDEYVGVMKGVIFARAPSANIVDLSHAVPGYDIRLAAYLISASYPYFPSGTVHVIIVDPGVGGSRDVVILLLEKQIFLAPDNGVLTLLLEKMPGVRAYRVSNQDLFLSPLSATFHGRDIFAPVAAYLANGGSLSEVGPEVSVATLKRLVIEKPQVDDMVGRVTGRVIHIDVFGNAMSNIQARTLSRLNGPFAVTIGGHTIGPLSHSYQEASPGEAVVLLNSRGYLEVAVSQGSAATLLEIGLDDQVIVTEYRRIQDK